MLLVWGPHAENHCYLWQSLSLIVNDGKEGYCLYCMLCALSSLLPKEIFWVLLFFFRLRRQSNTLFRSHLDELSFSFNVILLLIRSITGLFLLSVSRFSILVYLIVWICRILKVKLCKKCKMSLVLLFPPCITTFTLWAAISLGLPFPCLYLQRKAGGHLHLHMYIFFFLTQKITSFFYIYLHHTPWTNTMWSGPKLFIVFCNDK